MLYAHLNKYIDITKDIDIDIEAQVLQYTEINESSKFFAAYPLYNDKEVYHNSVDWINLLKDCILSWRTQTKKEAEERDAQENIDLWKKLNNKV